MDMSEVKAFNAELSGMYDNKPPISKAKMSAITRGAIKAIKFYKHVVHSVEKFIQKCKPEYKVPGLYVIDSIVRQSRHQFGQDKDVFAPRFAKNMQQTFSNLFRCPPEDKRNIIRVLNLWQKNNVFAPEVIQPLMDMADPNHPLHQEIQQQQNNASNGGSLNVSHATTDGKNSPAGQQQHSPQGPLHSPMGDSFQDQSSQPSNVKFNRKLLNDFEYDSEDDGGTPGASRAEPPPSSHHTQQNPADALGSILTNPEIMRQLQSLQAQMQLMTGMQGIQMPMPMGQDMQQMGQNQNQTLPFLSGQSEPQKQLENKEDGANESDIEFVETGPQVIEIPDANDSRSPSPSRRRRSRSPRRRRRGSRSRSRSPRSRRRGERDRDREREREKERDRDKEKNYKEREAEKEKQREREKKGLPPIKKDNLSVCSTTLWVGHLSKLATQEELSDLFGGYGGVVSIDVVGPRGCAFVVMERRRDAHKAKAKLDKHKLHSKEITVAWAPGKGVKGREWKDYWEAEFGVSYLPWERLEQLWRLGLLSMDSLEEGGAVDEDTLPPWLPPRIIPKTMMDGPPMNAMMGMPPVNAPGMMPNLPNMPNMPSMPPGMPNMPGLGASGLLGAAPAAVAMPVPRLPLPGMTPGMPPGIAPGMPPGIRPPSIPAGVPGLTADGLPLLGFPAPLPAGFLGGLMRLGLLPPPPQRQQQEVTRTDDAMDLDTEENHTNEAPSIDAKPDSAPLSLPDQLQALLSKPPPNFNSAEPPPNFNASEPPPAFNASIPPPSDEKPDDDKKERDRDRDRRDRDRDRGRDRDGDRRERRDRDRRDRGDRDRDRRDRGGDERRGGGDERRVGGDERRAGGDERRGDRDRDRERDRGRDRRDRDRDGNKERERFPRDNREASREKSPCSAAEQSGEKTLQQRLWEMANGKPDAAASQARDGFDIAPRQPDDTDAGEAPPPARRDRPPPLLEAPEPGKPDGGWTQLPPPRAAPPHIGPTFRAELRLRGQPRPPIRGPWMDGPGPNFGPRFNGMGPPFRPPFERPPFEGGPMFDGPPRFERPPFSRMPFDGPRPPFDGQRPPFDGPRPPFDGPRPPFDGPRPPFDGPRPPFDGPRPPFDGPPFDGPPFDGPPFDGPPDFFDRNNRRFDDREQFDRNWNGNNRERDPEWDNWDDRRQNRDRRSRDREDRFSRDRGDRRRNFDDRRSNRDDRGSTRDDRNSRDEKRDSKEEKTPTKDEKPKEEKAPRNRDKDRKSRWGAAEETTQEEPKPAADTNQEGPTQEAAVDRFSSQSDQVSTEIPPREERMDSQTADNSNRDSNENMEIGNENETVGNNESDNQALAKTDDQPSFHEENFSANQQEPTIDVRLSESNEESDPKTVDTSFSQPEERQPEERQPEIETPVMEKELVFELPESLRSDAVSEERNEPQDSENASGENIVMEGV